MNLRMLRNRRLNYTIPRVYDDGTTQVEEMVEHSEAIDAMLTKLEARIAEIPAIVAAEVARLVPEHVTHEVGSQLADPRTLDGFVAAVVNTEGGQTRSMLDSLYA